MHHIIHKDDGGENSVDNCAILRQFHREHAASAKVTCLVSRALAGVAQITLAASLAS